MGSFLLCDRISAHLLSVNIEKESLHLDAENQKTNTSTFKPLYLKMIS